ncbi:flagellar M-ring protein FliF [Actibacterium mucosum KCTC 23349]|uniref:Flagellar M-ring protein n=1 Tax=Actibacterium mucosum KCTC 23349 TaxID=1454373 RepID=A0A037ZNU1_9RHOB|nr:flagellar basal-body MS-ring/collar protein FliF [Actibacterium mucosum]KAJ57330.1 flagellar M-ring protein FliF [Actibacterium mucosum KCTC 23349]
MQQLLAVWNQLDARKRVIVGIATLAMFALVLAMSRIATKPQLSLLYSGLESAAAGEVVTALEQRGITYEVRGASIFVETARRDQLRMMLAGEGLPANGTAGYELLDGLSGFGTTSQMFDAAYWRAREGELARTISSSPNIRSSRVHIASPSNQTFQQGQALTASVTVFPARGSLPQTHANALRYLVASSVQNLTPENVSVINGDTGTVLSGDLQQSALAGAANERSEALRANVERLLNARMGPGKAVVEVTVETVTDRESIVERRFDPEGRVAISTETQERSVDANDQGALNVTVASNLPDGGNSNNRSSTSSNTETRERINYEVSETQREVVRGPGAIRRISVAVLLDGVRSIGSDGSEVWEPLPEEEIEALRDLVASAVGFNAERGDVITLKSMPFEPLTASSAPEPQGALATLPFSLATMAPLLVLAVVALILGLFVVRPVLTARGAPQPLPEPEQAPLLPNSLDGEITDDAPDLAAVNQDADDGQLPALADTPADPVSRLRVLIDDRRAETIEILRDWMEDDTEEPA